MASVPRPVPRNITRNGWPIKSLKYKAFRWNEARNKTCLCSAVPEVPFLKKEPTRNTWNEKWDLSTLARG